MNVPLNNRILLVDDNPAIHEDFRKILLGASAKARTELDAMESVLFDRPFMPAMKVTFELASAYQGKEALEKVTESLRLRGHDLRVLTSTHGMKAEQTGGAGCTDRARAAPQEYAASSR